MLEQHLRSAGSDRAHVVVRAFIRALASATAADVREWVDLLLRTLPGHFAREEVRGGFFDHLEGSGVSVLLVERLRADHQELLTQLRDLGVALSEGRDVRTGLTTFAERLREHEWIESVTAAQRGVPAPISAPELSLAGRTLDAQVAEAVDRVAERSRAIAAESSTGDLLAAISVGVPEQLPLEGVLARLDHGLATRGLDFVDVAPCASPDGNIRLCGARFRRPRVGPYFKSNFSIR